MIEILALAGRFILTSVIASHALLEKLDKKHPNTHAKLER